jgi:luciferase family oxidoreductase group 1
MWSLKLSVLDLAPITQGGSAADALRNSLDFARHAERLGFRRYWLAEHHNMPGIASAATSIVIGHVAAGTKTIRVGAGGIMLPNHAPLVVAEQFGTLESLFPGRIDLGLGRAPGTDQVTAHALRRTLASDPEAFPQDVLELMGYFEPVDRGAGAPGVNNDHGVRAVPGSGLRVPIYILGSSTFGAQVAAALGLPFAFASHFAAQMLLPAIKIYRERFRADARLKPRAPDLDRPYVMLGINVVAADTEEEARMLATSGRESFASLRRGHPIPLPPPNRAFEKDVIPFGTIPLEEMMLVAFVGTKDTIADGLRQFAARTKADELIATSHIYDHAARVRSLEILAEAGALL